jgi:hypothetical protein
MDTVGGTMPGLMVMLADAVAVTALASVAMTLTVKVVDVVTVYVVVKLAPVPDAGLPPVAVQEKVYAAVPPEPVAVKVTGVPEPPAVGPAMLTVNGSAAIVTIAEAVAVAALASMIVTETVLVPFTE